VDTRKLSIIILLIIIIGVAAGVAAHHQESPSRKGGTTKGATTGEQQSNNNNSTLVIAMGDWGPPSPFLYYPRGPGYVLTSLIFDTLVWKNSTGVIPWLAESWSHPNATTWVFHLRRGVEWQDGKPLTARDVVFTYKYIMEKHWAWKNIGPDLIREVYAPDNYTVVFVLTRPYAFFLQDVASTVFILPEHIWANVSNPYSFRSKQAFIGSGPYMLESYKPGEGYVFKANPHFWAGKPVYNTIKVVTVGFTNPQAEAQALKTGRIDTAVFMGKAYRVVEQLEKSVPGLRVQSGPMYWVLFLGFNLNKYPYNNTLFRQAVAYSLNLTSLVLQTAGTLKAAVPGTPNYVPPYSPFYNPHVPEYPYNPGKAAQILDSLGLRDVNGDGCRELPNGQPWHPLLVTSKQYTQEALVVKSMLARVGICVNVKTVESFHQLDAIVSRGDYDLEINGHGADGNTPTAFTWYFSGRFGAKWTNQTYMQIVAEIENASSPEQAYKLAEQAQVVIAEQLPRIALYYPNVFVVTRPGVQVHWFFTYGGIDGGIPLPYNKLALISPRPGTGLESP